MNKRHEISPMKPQPPYKQCKGGKYKTPVQWNKDRWFLTKEALHPMKNHDFLDPWFHNKSHFWWPSWSKISNPQALKKQKSNKWNYRIEEVLYNVKNESPFITSKNSSKNLSYVNKHSENWHFISHFVWKTTKTLELLRIFDELFDVINSDQFLTLYKTSAIMCE